MPRGKCHSASPGDDAKSPHAQIGEAEIWKASSTMKTGLLTLEASFRTSVEDRARAKAMKTAIVLGTALMMFIATIGLNVWLAFH